MITVDPIAVTPFRFRSSPTQPRLRSWKYAKHRSATSPIVKPERYPASTWETRLSDVVVVVHIPSFVAPGFTKILRFKNKLCYEYAVPLLPMCSPPSLRLEFVDNAVLHALGTRIEAELMWQNILAHEETNCTNACSGTSYVQLRMGARRVFLLQRAVRR